MTYRQESLTLDPVVCYVPESHEEIKMRDVSCGVLYYRELRCGVARLSCKLLKS